APDRASSSPSPRGLRPRPRVRWLAWPRRRPCAPRRARRDGSVSAPPVLLRSAARPHQVMLRAAQQRAGGGLDVALAHQALADEDRRNAGAGENREIGRGKNTALADRNAVPRDPRRKAPAGGERGLEGP